jgi:hypothetical protein
LEKDCDSHCQFNCSAKSFQNKRFAIGATQFVPVVYADVGSLKMRTFTASVTGGLT